MSSDTEHLRDEVSHTLMPGKTTGKDADKAKGTRSQVVVAGAIAGLVSRFALPLSLSVKLLTDNNILGSA